MRDVVRQLPVLIFSWALSLVLLALTARPASAADLRDFITDLYGGDGIQTISTRGSGLDFETNSLVGLADLNTQIAAGLQSFTSGGGGSSYTFDIELGIPVENTESLGPLVAERASTIGARRISVGFFYTHVEFDSFQGEELSDLSIELDSADIDGDGILGPPGSLVELDRIRLDLDLEVEQDIFAFLAKYGISDHWEADVVLPIVRVTAKSRATASVLCNPTSPDLCNRFHQLGAPDSDPFHSSEGGTATGIGDVLLRSKFEFLHDRGLWPDMAVRGQIRLPTGNEEDLLGTGETAFQLLLIASKNWKRFTPHLNVGYEFSTGRSELDNLRYAGGFEDRWHRRLTVAVDVLGRYAPHADNSRKHQIDLAVGARINVWRSLLLNANFQVPLNRDIGLRSNFVWSLGVEYNFGWD
jgi:hypothetical protein